MLRFNLRMIKGNVIFGGVCEFHENQSGEISVIRLEEIKQPHIFPPVFPVFIISIISVLSGRERGSE